MTPEGFFRPEDKQAVSKLVYYASQFGIPRSEMAEWVKSRIRLGDPFSMTDDEFEKWNRYIDALIEQQIKSLAVFEQK